MSAKIFIVDGYSEGDVQTASHEAGHAVVASSLGVSVSKIILYGERASKYLGTCFLDPTRWDSQIIISFAGHHAERALGFPRDIYTPTFTNRDSDYTNILKNARFHVYWRKAEQALGLSCAYDDDADFKKRKQISNRMDMLRRTQRICWRRLIPIINPLKQQTDRLISRPENLHAIKAIAAALLHAPRDKNEDRTLTEDALRRALAIPAPMTARWLCIAPFGCPVVPEV